MTREDIIKLARKAGFDPHDMSADFTCNLKDIERFADLAIKPWADQLKVERKRFQELNEVAALGMQHARADEREACARVADDQAQDEPYGHAKFRCANIAAAIRARGQDPMPLFDDWGKDWTK